MNLNRKWSVLTAGAVALSLVLAACSSGTKAPTPAPAPVTPTEATGDTGKPVDGGTLTWATTSDIRTLNPLFINDTPLQSLANLVFAPILNWDSKGTPVADEAALAAEMPTISADGLTYTVKLKSTPKWTDGKPVTADDVVFTLNAWKDPEVASPSIAAYDKVADVKKVDDTTVEIKMKEVYAPFIYTLTTAILPAHILKDVPPTELIKHKYGTDPATFVSNGPYKWASWTQQQSTSLEADPNYWAAKKTHIKTIIYKKYADQNTQLQALVKGEVDLIEQIPVASLAAAQNKPDIKLVEGPGNAYDFVGFNFNKENWPDGFVPFEGKKTRQAIAHALNRKGMVDSVLKGHGTLLNGPFLPGAWADAGTAINYDYNVETAKKLLAEDGWKPGSDGILEKDGHKFEFKLQFMPATFGVRLWALSSRITSSRSASRSPSSRSSSLPGSTTTSPPANSSPSCWAGNSASTPTPSCCSARSTTHLAARTSAGTRTIPPTSCGSMATRSPTWPSERKSTASWPRRYPTTSPTCFSISRTPLRVSRAGSSTPMPTSP